MVLIAVLVYRICNRSFAESFLEKRTARQIFLTGFLCSVSLNNAAYSQMMVVEPFRGESQSRIGIFDGVYEELLKEDGAVEYHRLSPEKYDVAYNPESNSYLINHDANESKRQSSFLIREVNGSFAFSGSIVFSVTTEPDTQYKTLFTVQDSTRYFKHFFDYWSTSTQKTHTVSFWNGSLGMHDSDLLPLVNPEIEEIRFSITYYADLQQVVCEWSEDGQEGFRQCHRLSLDKNCYIGLWVQSTKSALFRLENVVLEPVHFVYGQRSVERMDSGSARVSIEVTNPTHQSISISLNENLLGDVSVPSISHGGSIKATSETLNLQRLQWNLSAPPGKTQLQYTVQSSNLSHSPTVIFQGNIGEKWILGKGDYPLAETVEKREDIKHWRNWSADDGLPMTKTRYITAGPSGNVYIVTYNALQQVSQLTKFNGYEFHSIPIGGLRDGFIKESLDGTLWFYENSHLYRLKRAGINEWYWEICEDVEGNLFHVTDQATPPFLYAGINSTLGGNTAKYTFVPLRPERVYCLNRGSLRLYNAVSKEETVILKADSTGLGTFKHMILGRDKNLWITGPRGVIKVDIQDTSHTIIESHFVSPDYPIRDFDLPVEGRDGNLLVRAHHPFIPGLDYAMILDPQFRIWGLKNEAPFSEVPISLNPENRVWLLGSIAGENEYLACQTSYEINVLPQQNNRITNRTGDFDNEGNGSFWLASDYGILRHSPTLWRQPEAIHDLQIDVGTIVEDANGNLWALERNSLIQYDGREWKRYSKSGVYSFLQHESQSIAALPDGTLAIHIGETKLNPRPFCVFDSFQEIFNVVSHPERFTSDFLAPGKDHSLLLAAYDQNGNARLDSFANDRFTPLIDQQEGLRIGIHCIYERENGDILIGNDSDEPFQWYRDGKKMALSGDRRYPGSSVLSILDAGNDKIWVGDINNLYEFDGESWSIIRANMDKVLSMIRTRDGSIWIAAWTGLHRYREGSWVTHNTEDGFRYDRINEIFEDRQGRLWAGTSDGIYLYHPEADPDPPQTYIIGEENLKEFSAKGEVRIAFSGVDRWKYTEKERLLFSYRLNEGRWSPYEGRTLASFSHLAPGDYTIEVRAMDRNFKVDPTPSSFSFVVNPEPIQERTWFVPAVLGTFFLILLLAVIAIRSRFQLARFARNLEQMVTERTQQLRETEGHLLTISEHEQQRIGQDLHDDVVQELVGIAMHSELILQEVEKQAPQTTEELRKVLQKVDEATLKTRRLARGLAPVQLDQIGLMGALQSLGAGIEYLYGISCSIEGDEKVELEDHEQSLNFYRIAQEAATNAVKHSQAKKIAITLHQDSERVRLAIQDDGRGFDPRLQTEGMGLQILRYRANRIGAELSVESQPGRGTTVTCILSRSSTPATDIPFANS